MRISRISRKSNIINDLLEHYGIEDIEGFKRGEMNFEKSDLLKKKVAGAKDAIGYIVSALALDLKIGIVVDDDADGFTSSAILYNYLKDLSPDSNIETFHHDNKTHGLTDQIMTDLQESNLDLILIPDAGANDKDQHDQLVYCGSKVIVIDHHIIEEDESGKEIPTSAIIVSNQNPNNEKEINHKLTGAGMVLRLCESIDEVTGNNYADQYYDLAAIGQIGDASDISDPEIHSIVQRGMKNFKSPFLKQAIGDHLDKDVAPPIGMSFSVIPMINAITRVGTKEEKIDLFKAMTEKEEPEIVTEMRRRKNKETGKFEQKPVEFSTMELKIEKFMKIKDKQAKLVKLALEQSVYKNHEGSVAVVELENFNEKIGGITGLIANKIASKLQMPALVLVDRGEEMVGSGRGFVKKIKDLRSWVNKTELAEWAKGHDNAFGTSIKKDNFDEFLKKANSGSEDEAEEQEFEVVEVQTRNINQGSLLEVIDNQHLFGGEVKSPLFYFEDIEISKSSITIMAGGTCISWWHKGITFISFGLPVGSADLFDQGFKTSFRMNFVGSPSLSKWRGKETLQVIVEEYGFYEENSELEFDEDSFIF